MWQEDVDNHRCGVKILVCTGDEHILGCRTIIFPIFPTNYNYRKKGKEMVRNAFLYFPYFLRVKCYRGKWKKRKEIISYISYISYELYLIVRNGRKGEKDFLCFLYFLRVKCYREKGKEMVRNAFLYFPYFPRIIIIVRKVKKW